ncbi:MAG: alanine racemase, partial [Candidatus Cloacimonadota bacterium]|nr:alanine racemase [Candidatus Cloacimonadota bacterium]
HIIFIKQGKCIMGSTSTIDINLEAIKNNINFVKTLVDLSTIISAVIKGNAYGHGIPIMVNALELAGINHFSVYSSAEAKTALEAKSSSSTIMIMGFIWEEDYKWIIENNIEFYISNIHSLKKAIEYSKMIGKKARIHIDVETGMNRTGLSIKVLDEVTSLIKCNSDFLDVIGITSHFAGAESIANYTRIKKQYSVYKQRVKYFKDKNIIPKIKHVASSAAAINYPHTHLDLVRIGILVYGYWPTKETFINYIQKKKDNRNPLKRALSWNTQVVSLKEIPVGEFIGYGMNYQAQTKMQVMLVPVGYTNGYSRSLSNMGHVLVRGFTAPIVGSVNMNMIICNITNTPKIHIGDKVVLIGKQGNQQISFASFAEMNNSLNYEILARLPENIERKLIDNSNHTKQ